MAHHTWRITLAHTLAHTVVPTAGNWGQQTDPPQIWPSFYSSPSLFVHSMVEEAAAACGTKNTSSTWSLQTSWPCLDTATPKMVSLGLPLSEKPPPFSTLIHVRCRRRRISPSSCSLPPILLAQRDETFNRGGRGTLVINLGTAGTGGGKEFILCFCLEHQEVRIPT